MDEYWRDPYSDAIYYWNTVEGSLEFGPFTKAAVFG